MKEKKRIINGKTVFSVFIVLLLIAVVTTLFFMNRVTYDDDYFVTDDTKIVLSMDAKTTGFEDSKYVPPITHVVYYYSGDEITGVKVFYEYKDNEVARKANEKISMDGKDWANSKALNGKYIIFSMNKDEYEGVTATDTRESVKSIMGDEEFDRESCFYYGYNGED